MPLADDGSFASMVGEWPAWSGRVAGAVGVGICLWVGAERDIFTHPGWAVIPIAMAALPWFLDIFDLCHPAFNRWPQASHLVWSAIIVGSLTWILLGFPRYNDGAPFIAVFAVGEITSTAGPKMGAIPGIGSACLLLGLQAAGRFDAGAEIWLFALFITWMGANAVRWQMRTTTELREAQGELARQAVEEERRRLAREIHDLIAHSLAVTMLHMTGARLALKDGDTAEALAGLEDAEAHGRRAMAEIHRTVGLLGPSGANGSRLPTPCASDLLDLVHDFEAAGLMVTFDAHGDLTQVPLASGLAAYRIVQESLANAVKHAPGAPVTLKVAAFDREVRVTASNPHPVDSLVVNGSGNGLRGMAERAELLGGIAEGRHQDGHWVVSAVLPWADETPA